MSLIIVSGCSYTHNAVWPEMVFAGRKISNFAVSGAGNKYIADSIIHGVDPSDPPDFVYVVFSGVNRSDIVVPMCNVMDEFAQKYQFRGYLGDSIYLFSGGDRGDNDRPFVRKYQSIRRAGWPDINSFSDWIKLPINIKRECVSLDLFEFEEWSIDHLINSAWNLRYWPNRTFLETETYRSVIKCLDFLTLHHIKYAFSFFYDVFNTEYDTINSFGCLTRTHPLYSRIDWSKMITPFPFDLALKHDHILEDGCHQSRDGERLYADHIQNQLTRMLEENA